MAIQARFVADFESFFAAVEKSQVQLKGFEAGANKVEGALGRMVDNFSGRKLIQEATLMTRVLGDVDSIALLTGKELQAAGAKAAEAAEKMKKVGLDVPEKLQAIADAAHNASHEVGLFGPQVVELAAGFLTAQAIMGAFTTAFHLAVSAIKEIASIALTGAAVADVEENFQHLTQEAGLLGSALLGTLRTGTHNTITDFELMKTVNKDLTAGLKLTDAQFGTLSKGAFALAQATGGDVKTALDTMNDAMLTGRTRALALLTGKIDLTKAENDFAKSLGKNVDQLNESGKLEAARAGILDAVTKATERLGEQTDGLDERVAQVETTWANFREELGKVIATSKVLEVGLDGLRRILLEAFGGNQDAAVRAIADAVDSATIALIGLGRAGVEVAGFLSTEFFAAKKVFGDLAQIIDGVRLSILLVRQAQAAGLGFIPNSADFRKWKELDDAILKLEITMKRRGDSLQADSAAQAGVTVETTKWTKSLDALQASMESARHTSAAFVGPVEALARGHSAAALGLNQYGESLTKLSPAQQAHIKALEAVNQKIADAQREIGTLTELQKESVLSYQALGLSNEEIALKMGLSVLAIKAYETEFKNLLKEFKDNEEATANFQQGLGKLLVGYNATGKMAVGFTGILHVQDPQIIQNAKSLVQLQHELDETAAAFKKAFGIFAGVSLAPVAGLTSGQSQINHILAGTTKEAKSLAASLTEVAELTGVLSQGFANLAQTSSGSFGGLTQQIGKVVAGLNLATQAMAKYAAATTTAGKASAGLSAALIGIGILSEIADAIDQAAKEEELARINKAWDDTLQKMFHSFSVFSEDLKHAINTTEIELQKLFHTETVEKNIRLLDAKQQALFDSVQGNLDKLTPDQFANLFGALDRLSVDAAAALHLSDIIKEMGDGASLTADQINDVHRSFSLLLGLMERGDRLAVQAAEELVKSIEALGARGHLTGAEMTRLFDIIIKGGPASAIATSTLDKVLTQMGTTATTTGGLVSQLFLDAIKKAKDLNLVLGETGKFLLAQAQSAAGGLNEILAGLAASAKANFQQIANDASKMLTIATKGQADAFGAAIGEKLKAGVALTSDQIKKLLDAMDKGLIAGFTVTLSQAKGLTAAIAADFAAMVAGGMSVKEALAALGPSINLLQHALDEAGIDGGAAFALIRAMAQIANDAFTGPLLDSIGGVGKALKGLHNSGILTQEMFQGLVETAVDSFNRIVATGVDRGAAFAAVHDTLQTIWELQKKFGFTVDANTQKLIDEAVAAGQIGAQFESPADRMIDALERIGDTLDAIALSMNVTLPQAAKDGAKTVTDELNKVPKTLPVEVAVSTSGMDKVNDAFKHIPKEIPVEVAFSTSGTGEIAKALQNIPNAVEVPVRFAVDVPESPIKAKTLHALPGSNVLRFTPRATPRAPSILPAETIAAARTGTDGSATPLIVNVTVQNRNVSFRTRQDSDEQATRIADAISRKVRSQRTLSRR